MRIALCSVALIFALTGCGSDDDDAGANNGGTGGSGATGATGGSDSGGSSGSGGQNNGGSSGSSGSGGSSNNGYVTPFKCPAGFDFAEGENNGVQLGDYSYTFFVDYPQTTDKPLAVIFQWHGYGDTATNFRTALGLNPDGDADFPFIRVTPDDSNRIPPNGLDWALFNTGDDVDKNPDLEIFAAITGCLIEKHNADPNQIYSVGFSAGAIMSNFLQSYYPNDLAANVAYSGAWFNDKAETDKVNALNFTIDYNWPALDPQTPGAVIITHGGGNDEYYFQSTKIIDFEDSAQAALPFLEAANRTVIDCAHTNGHQPHPQVNAGIVTEFFKAHKRGEQSPYKEGGLPAGFPTSCTLR